MDYYSVDSELIESLDFLRPPVKRSSNNVNTERLVYLHSKLNNSRYAQYTGVKRNIESLRSFAYKKSDKKVVQQFAALRCTTLISRGKEKAKQSTSTSSQEKPLIKVTVIPKTSQTPISSLLRKRKRVQKRIHNTVSSHENFRQRKDVYCLVAHGEDSEKIYGVKATGSDNLASSYTSHSKDADIKLEQISSLKLVLDSLNMDKKGTYKKRKKKGETATAGHSKQADSQEENKQFLHKCLCPNPSRNSNITPSLPCQKSSVKISGQLDLDEDNTYVLRCAATVNDKPVAPNFTRPMVPKLSLPVGNSSQIYRVPCQGMCGKTQGQQKDFCTQADLLRDIASKRDGLLSQESQGTQVNFDIQINTCELSNKSLQNECTQCCYGGNYRKIDIHTNLPETKDSKILKRNNSPCVIISVFNNQDGCENVKVVTNTKDGEKRVIRSPGFTKQNKTQTSSHNISTKKNVKESNNIAKNDVTRPKRSVSPQSKNQSKVDLPEAKNQKTGLRTTSPQRIAPATTSHKMITNVKNIQEKPPLRKSRESTRISPKRGNAGNNKTKDKTTNTDAGLTKKYLVNTYTEKIARMMGNNNKGKQFHATRSDPSKVTINIDGDTEFYNVLLHQGLRSTDLKVRKTIKTPEDIPLCNPDDASITSPSLTNFLLASDKSSDSPIDFRLEDETQLLQHSFSKLCVRDSIEISHRREDIPNTHNENENFHSSNEPSAPIKHFRGDDCPIQDPVMRDKEIRALLGIDKLRPAACNEAKKRDVPVWYFFGQKRDKNSKNKLNKQIDNETSEPPCICCDASRDSDSCISLYIEKPPYLQVKPKPKKVKEIKQVISDCECRKVMDAQNEIVQCECEKERGVSCKCKPVIAKEKSSSLDKPTNNNLNAGTQYEEVPMPTTSFYQQLILNRNIQIFLQLEQFSKQKPIILSRKQYERVKRTIERTISHKTSKRAKCICKTSLVSVGDVRKKEKKNTSIVFSNNAQTDDPFSIRLSSNISNPSKSRHGALAYMSKECPRYNRTGFKTSKVECNQAVIQKPAVQGEKVSNSSKVNIEQNKSRHEVITVRSAVSSRLDPQRFTSVSCLKPIKFSSTNVEAGSICAPAISEKKSHSIHTIFKGHRRTATPNLGTSVYSLESEENNKEMEIFKPLEIPEESKQRKPFLRRLMSCLVMRSARASDVNISKLPPLKMPSIESSIDSYHISTSLGAVEVSSSIYDTSASFYSNHSVYPVNSKMKRGFFNSVREFLTNRKS